MSYSHKARCILIGLLALLVTLYLHPEGAQATPTLIGDLEYCHGSNGTVTEACESLTPCVTLERYLGYRFNCDVNSLGAAVVDEGVEWIFDGVLSIDIGVNSLTVSNNTTSSHIFPERAYFILDSLHWDDGYPTGTTWWQARNPTRILIGRILTANTTGIDFHGYLDEDVEWNHSTSLKVGGEWAAGSYVSFDFITKRVPEPTMLLLFAAGLLGLDRARRRHVAA